MLEVQTAFLTLGRAPKRFQIIKQMKNVSIYPNNSSKPPLTFTTAMGRLPYSNYERKL